MPKNSNKTLKNSIVAAAAAKTLSKKKLNRALFPKTPLTLKPPSPSAHNHIDTVSRINIEISASDYALAWATKGPPSSSSKPFTKPLEEKVSDSTDLKLNTYMNCYGLAKRKANGCSNEAKQFFWMTSDGEKKWNDWKVSDHQNDFCINMKN